MNKKIILSSFASLLFLSQAANAEIKIGKGSLTFNAGVSSQYIFRGIDNNKDAVTPFAGPSGAPSFQAIGRESFLLEWERSPESSHCARTEADRDFAPPCLRQSDSP